MRMPFLARTKGQPIHPRGFVSPDLRATFGPGATYPVDVVGGVLPLVVYGTRKLVSNYTGPAIRVRRASDNAEQDIAFLGVDLDTIALDTFIAGTTGFVKTYYDQTVAGNHATQTTTTLQPQIDGRTLRGARTLWFNDAQQMVIPAGVSLNAQTCTVLAAAAPHSYDTQCGFLELGASGQLWFFDQAMLGDEVFSPTAPNVQRNNLAIIGLRRSAAKSEIFTDENLVSSATVATSATKTGGFLGNLPAAGAWNLRGFISGMVIYGRTLSDTELAAGRAAMHTAFNVNATNAKMVFAFGDSLYNGNTNNGYGIINLAIDRLDGYRLCNCSQGGKLIADETALVNATFGSIIAANAPCAVVMQAGTNDIGQTADSAATIYARLTTFCSTVRALAGSPKVIVCTLTPATNVGDGYTTARQTVLTDYNALIRSGWSSIADGLIDYAQNAIMGSFAACSDTTLYIDQLHPTVYGTSLLVPETRAALSGSLKQLVSAPAQIWTETSALARLRGIVAASAAALTESSALARLRSLASSAAIAFTEAASFASNTLKLLVAAATQIWAEAAALARTRGIVATRASTWTETAALARTRGMLSAAGLQFVPVAVLARQRALTTTTLASFAASARLFKTSGIRSSVSFGAGATALLSRSRRLTAAGQIAFVEAALLSFVTGPAAISPLSRIGLVYRRSRVANVSR